jgi:hypothetical protein
MENRILAISNFVREHPCCHERTIVQYGSQLNLNELQVREILLQLLDEGLLFEPMLSYYESIEPLR